MNEHSLEVRRKLDRLRNSRSYRFLMPEILCGEVWNRKIMLSLLRDTEISL